MKQIFIFIYFLLTINVFSQDPQTHFILEDEIPSNVTKDYIGRDFVQILTGFSSSPDPSHHVLAKTNPLLVFPPEGGDITGGSTNNNEGGVVGTLPGNLMVSPSGAALYKIPINVPMARGGLSLSLGLEYNSQTGNGLFGVGWSLSGLSVITRSSTTIYNEGYIDGVDFDDNDQFMLNGQRLIPINTENTEFRTEIESYSKIIVGEVNDYGPVWFEVYTKDGLILEFGKTVDSRLLVLGNDNIFKWKLNRIRDHQGNYIDYSYLTSLNGRASRIEYILYGGNTITGENSIYQVSFESEYPRPDINHTWGGGNHYSLYQYFEKINITHTRTMEKIMQYVLDYDHGFYLHLKSVTINDKYGNIFNPTKFEWGANNHQLENETLNYNQISRDKVFIDFNGDGKTDMIELYSEIDNNNKKKYVDWKFRKRLDSGFSNELNFTAGIDNYVYSFTKGDFNGDGLDDIVRFIYTNSDMNEVNMDLLLLSNGDGFDCYNMSEFQFDKGLHPDVKSGDFNGDGIDEIIVVKKGFDVNGNGNNSQILNFSSTYPFYEVTLETRLAFGNTNIEGSQLHIGDFTGDGRSDVMMVTEWGAPPGQPHFHKAYINEIDLLSQSTTTLNVTENYPTTFHRVFPGDFNGDGITDILTFDVITSTWEVMLYDGRNEWRSFISAPQLYPIDPYGIVNGSINSYWYAFSVSDYNGDGKSDIAQFHLRENRDIADYDVFYCRGTSFEQATGEFPTHGGFVTTGENNIVNKHFNDYNDFNGDGKSDIYLNNGYYDDEIFFFDKNNDYNLIKKVTNGLGHETGISYSLLTNNSIYTKGSGAVYPLTDIQPPINVVTSIDVDNGIGSTITINHLYEGAKMHKEGKGFLGFSKTIKITNPNTNKTTRTENSFNFNLDYYFRWSEKSKSYADTESSSDEPITETINEQPVIKDFGNKRIFYYTPQSLTKVHHTGDVNSNYVKTVLSKFSYSDNDIQWGNLTTMDVFTEPVEVDFSTPEQAYDFYTKKAFDYYPANINEWFIGLNKETITETWDKDGGTSDFQKVNLTYSTNSQLLETITNLPNNELRLSTITTNTYDTYGNILSSKIEVPSFIPAVAPRITQYSYNDESSNQHRFLTEVKTVVDGVDYTTSATYYPATGQKKSETQIDGLTTNYYYDGFGRLGTVAYPDGIIDKQMLFWSSSHDDNPDNGLFYNWSLRSGEQEIITFANKLEQDILTITKDIDNRSIYTNTIFNDLGKVHQSSNPHYSLDDVLWTTYSYNNTGSVKKIISPIATIEYVYNGKITTSKNLSINKQSSKERNAIGSIIKATDEGGTIDYTYYSSGQQKTINYLGSIISYTYDKVGYIEKMEDPDAGSIIYNYNPIGELISQTNANGYTYEMEFDLLGRLKSKALQGSVDDDVEYSYCPKGAYGFGQLQSISKANGIHTDFVYDDKSRVIEKSQTIDAETYTFSYDYNVLGKIKTKTWPSEFAVDYHYKNGYFCAVEQSNTGTILWSLENINAQGNILQYRLGNGLLTTKGVDIYGYPESIYTDNQVQNHIYDFDLNTGNINWRESIIYLPHGSRHTLKEVFTYDENVFNNRLKSWKVENVGPVFDVEYSNTGNIISKSDVGSFVYDNQNEGPHALSKIIEPTESYLTKAKNNKQIITYTGFDKTKTIWQFNPANPEQSSLFEITYGPEQSRRKTVLQKNNEIYNTTYFIGNSMEIEIDANNKKRQLHYLTAGDGLFGIYVIDDDGQGSMYYIHKDYLGSIETITNHEAEVVERLSFDPWGRRRNVTDWSYVNIPISFLFNRGYTGHEHMDEFDIINMNGRTYDPILGRFLSPDNYVQAPYYTQSFNRYSYVLNNPLKYTDPNGEWVLETLAFMAFVYLKTAHDNRDADGNWAWNPSNWGGSDFQIQVGVNTNTSFSNTTYFGSAGPGNFNPGVSYNSNQGIGFGSTYNGNSSFYYPNYNYGAPEQNAEASIDKTISNGYNDWRAGSAGGGDNNVTYPDGSVGLMPSHSSTVDLAYTNTYVTTSLGKRLYYSEDYTIMISKPLSTHSAVYKHKDAEFGFRVGYEAGYNGNYLPLIISNIGGAFMGPGNPYPGNFNAGFRSGRYDTRYQYKNWLNNRYHNITYY